MRHETDEYGGEMGRKPEGAYIYWGNCIDSTYEDISDLNEDVTAVTWRTFKKHIPDAREKLEEISAIWEDTTEKQIASSWFLDFFKGTFMDTPAYFIAWSGIEWIWVEK